MAAPRQPPSVTSEARLPAGSEAALDAARASAAERWLVIAFEYVGATGLTAVGGATGRVYRFDRPHARIVVDPRDRPSLAVVPHLRQV